MSPLNFFYAAILSVVFAHWFYRLAIQHVDEPDRPQKVSVYMGSILVGFMASVPLLKWLATPDLELFRWWSYIIPNDQLPSRIFFWVLVVILVVIVMAGVMTSKGWKGFISDDVGTEGFGWVIVTALVLFLLIGITLSYSFCLTLLYNMMRLV